MRRRGRTLLALLLLTWWACDGRHALRIVTRDAGPITDGSVGDTVWVPAAACPAGQSPRLLQLGTPVKLDLLFMIDDSPSMEEEQANLARNFPRLIEALAKMPSGFPDLHLGVVSSDMGAASWVATVACGVPESGRALLQVPADCGVDTSRGHFLMAPRDGSASNYQGDIAQAFACMAKLGTSGCGFEHQLQAVRTALSGLIADNHDFLRPDAHLAVVYITDEDDCSAPANSTMFSSFADGIDGSLLCSFAGHVCNGSPPPAAEFSTALGNCSAAPDGGGKLIPVQTFIDEMHLLRTQSVSISVIGGWPEDVATAKYAIGYSTFGTKSLLSSRPICKSSNGSAAVGLRLKQFVDAFGPAGKIISICQDDFSDAMAQVGELINTTVECQ